MTATAAEVARVRRMAAEPDNTTYTDSDVEDYIERYPVVDARGENPYVESTTTPGTLEVNEDWTATYDLNAAAADIWTEKAAALAANYDFETQDQRFERSQAYEQALQQSRYYRSRRSVMTRTLRPEPKYPYDQEDLSN
jgi:hypothetical protein